MSPADSISGDEKSKQTEPKKSAALENLRQKLNEVDVGLIDLLATRRQISSEIAKAKSADGMPLRDAKREQEILVEYIKKGKQKGLDAHFVTKVFHEIIDDSVRLQFEYLQARANSEATSSQMVRVAFHGIEGSYSHLAALKHFSKHGDQAVFLGRNTFQEVIKAVESGHADYAILPIENTTSGGINDVYDLLLHSQISIVGEEKYRIDHSLIAGKKVPLSQIKRIFCRPSVVTECSAFLSKLQDVKIEYLSDSALSVKKIKEDGDFTQAAIASQEAAQMFDMVVLEPLIANQAENFNRYIIAARKPVKVDSRIPCKTSLVMATAQKAGALVEALLAFRDRGINLTKLESRPIPGNPWEEMFYVDFEGNLSDTRVEEALNDITKGVRFIKVLGCYPSYDLSRTAIPQSLVLGGEASVKSTGEKAAKKETPTENVKAAPTEKKAKRPID